FQAEDGIRDLHVTGVHTCALPISAVALSGTREGRLREVAEEIGRAGGSERIHVVPGDLSKAEGAEAVARAAEEAMGQIDILVNRSEERRVGKEWRAGWSAHG